MRPRLPEPIRTADFIAVPFHIPEPGKPLQAYLAVPSTPKSAIGPYTPGQRVAHRSGFIAGNEPSTAFWNCDRWPFHLYEISVDPRDLVVGQGELLLKTTAFRVVRELGLEELLGPRAADVSALFDDLRAATWLAPAQPVDVETVRALVLDFYARVAEHVLVRAASIDIVRHWGVAHDADQSVTLAVDAPESLMSLTQAVRDAGGLPSPEDEALGFTTAAMRRIILHQHFARGWDAGWQASYACFLRESMKSVRPGDAKAAKRAWTKLRDQITDRRDAARRVALQEVRRMMGVVTSVRDLPEEQVRADGINGSILQQMVRRGGVSDVSIDAWNFAVPAVAAAIDVLDSLLVCTERPPMRPLFDLFRMGVWPIGVVGRKFVVYVPDPA